MTRAANVCWPWRLRDLAQLDHHPKGGICADCRKDVAVPRDVQGVVYCLYCGMDRGLVEMIDEPVC
jgi:hypothetical protein